MTPDDERRLARDNEIIATHSASGNGELVLYSGGENPERAKQFTQSGNYYRLDDTDVGRRLARSEDGTQKNIYLEYDDEVVADGAMRSASIKACHDARGNVNTFVVGAQKHRIFRHDEMPVLTENERVDSINGVRREELARLHARDPEAAFNRVCEAELQRDRERDGATRDYFHRRRAYEDQVKAQGRKAQEATTPLPEQERADRAERAEANRQKEQKLVLEKEQADKEGPER